MIRRLFLLILVLASMVILPTSVKAMEIIEYSYLGGEGKLIIIGPSDVVQENVGTCVNFGFNQDGDLLFGLMNISTTSLGGLTMGFTGSVRGKDMHLTFFPNFFNPATQMPIPGEELIAFAVGSFDKKNLVMKFVIQSPKIGTAQGYGALTGNFVLTPAGVGTFCSGF